jgi:gluconolactonase
MRAHVCLVACLLTAAWTVAIGQEPSLPKPTGESIVSADAKLELLFTRSAKIEGGLTEGPAVAPDGSIYFSDIPFGKDKGMILRFDPKTKKTTVFAEDSHKSNGLIFDAEGNLLACEGADYGGLGVARWNVKTGQRTVVAERYMGKRFNAPNDICVDSKGRIYFTDPKYLGHEKRELEHRAVYRIDKDGSVHEVTHETVKPNGIAISPDGKTLYVANNDNGSDDVTQPGAKPGLMNIEAYPLNADGSAGRRREIVNFGDKGGCDGMCVDEKGNVYLTVREPTRPGVMVVNPEGKEVAFIPTGPAGQSTTAADGSKKDAVGMPSNVEFGIGDDLNMLYITVDKNLYRVRLKARGFHVQYSQR